jgi:hypothetical protein
LATSKEHRRRFWRTLAIDNEFLQPLTISGDQHPPVADLMASEVWRIPVTSCRRWRKNYETECAEKEKFKYRKLFTVLKMENHFTETKEGFPGQQIMFSV